MFVKFVFAKTILILTFLIRSRTESSEAGARAGTVGRRLYVPAEELYEFAAHQLHVPFP